MVGVAVEDADHVQSFVERRQLHVAPVALGDAEALRLLVLDRPDVGQRAHRANNVVASHRFAQQQAAPLVRVTGRAVGADFVVKSRGQLEHIGR